MWWVEHWGLGSFPPVALSWPLCPSNLLSGAAAICCQFPGHPFHSLMQLSPIPVDFAVLVPIVYGWCRLCLRSSSCSHVVGQASLCYSGSQYLLARCGHFLSGFVQQATALDPTVSHLNSFRYGHVLWTLCPAQKKKVTKDPIVNPNPEP